MFFHPKKRKAEIKKRLIKQKKCNVQLFFDFRHFNVPYIIVFIKLGHLKTFDFTNL
jgi:hypothetical protein